ncbi:MAG: DUF6553 family protein [Fastidiosipilaceae bacterium]
MMEQNENQMVTMRCEKCDKEFNVPFNAANAFCVHCGTKQSVTPEQFLTLMSTGQDDQYELSLSINKLIRITDPDERKLYISSSTQIPKELRDLYESFWQIRYKPNKVKGIKWADLWLGFFQDILLMTKNQQTKGSLRKFDKTIRSFFLNKKMKSIIHMENYDTIVIGDYIDWKENIYVAALYHELLNVVYLYTKLSMTDRNYGSILFGFGRKKDSTIAEKISSEFINMQINGLSLLKESFYGYNLIIKVLHDGYRTYFDKNFHINI